ncbi:MAG: hypothetical protein LBE18_11915, partial [Planctomycetaceae bacterium]|nr:hypothetical protein [Planctomycetaceae bacterium]
MLNYYLKKTLLFIVQRNYFAVTAIFIAIIGYTIFFNAAENYLYAQSNPIAITGGNAITYNSSISAGVIITNSNYYDNNYSSGTTYSSSSSYFHLTNTYTITNSG